jgi:hypothetical protein
MTIARRLIIPLAVTATAAAAFVSTALGANHRPALSLVTQTRGTEYVTPTGSTSVFPGRFQVGDRILARDALFQGTHSVGYDNELCTVTFDNHDICQVVLVLPGKGQIQASWLWTHWPSNFSGVIDGGTGAYSHATGQFAATVLRNGGLKVTATLK